MRYNLINGALMLIKHINYALSKHLSNIVHMLAKLQYKRIIPAYTDGGQNKQEQKATWHKQVWDNTQVVAVLHQPDLSKSTTLLQLPERRTLVHNLCLTSNDLEGLEVVLTSLSGHLYPEKCKKKNKNLTPKRFPQLKVCLVPLAQQDFIDAEEAPIVFFIIFFTHTLHTFTHTFLHIVPLRKGC